MNIAKPLLVAVALASLPLPACSGTGAEDEGLIGTTQQAAHVDSGGLCHGSITHNSITQNSITHNSITHNSITQNSITHNALTESSMAHNSILHDALSDPNSRAVFADIVGCALPADQTIQVTVDGTAFSYQGELALAPEWGEPDGSCDKSCQGWVSACLLARVDFLGQKREISVRGENPGLQSCPAERATFTQREATYYGNVFVTPQIRYACLSPGQTEDPRVCGPSLDGCVVDMLGSCDDLCGKPRADGSFPDCRAPDADDADGQAGPHGRDRDDVFEGSVTVFLKP
jgi:hypothetical protein